MLEDQVEVTLDNGQSALEFIREHKIVPPSITVESIWNILKDLCEADDIDIEDPHNHLKPHGDRRGVGESAL